MLNTVRAFFLLAILPVFAFAQNNDLQLRYKADFECISYDYTSATPGSANGPVVIQMTEDNQLHASYIAELAFTVNGQMTPVNLQGSLYAAAPTPRIYRSRFELCNADLSLANLTRPQILAYTGSAQGNLQNQDRCPTALRAGNYFSQSLGLINLPGGGTASVSCVITFSNSQ